MFVFGELLKSFRIRAGIKQEELAERIGIGRTTISAWERHLYRPKYRDIIFKIQEELNLSPIETDQLLSAAHFPLEFGTAVAKQSSIADATVSGILNFRVSIQFLPPVHHFTGREKEIRYILENLQPGRVLTLCGPPGIGKSALASEAARRLPLDRFPDGVFFHSFYKGAETLSSRDLEQIAFEQIARAFGEEPTPTPEAAARRALAGKRALLVLDGTENLDDVEKVLAVRSACGALVTSRRRADMVQERLYVGPLPFDQESGDESDAVVLLKKWGGARVSSSMAALRICELVGGLALAIRLAGSYIVSRQQEAPEYLEWLENAGLAALDLGERQEQSVPLLLKRSLENVSVSARHALAVAGQLALSPFDRDTIATALKAPASEVGRWLGELVNYSFLDRPKAHYQVIHALIHTYARLHMEAPGETTTRLATYYTLLAEEQSKLRVKGYVRLDEERAHVMAVLARCVALQEWENTLALAQAVDDYLDRQGHWTELLPARHDTLRAAQALNMRQAEGAALRKLGNAYIPLGQVRKGIDLFEQALALSRQIGDRQGESVSLNNLGVAYHRLGEIKQALDYYEQALAVSREIGDRQGEADSLGNLGTAYYSLGDVNRTIEYRKQALAINKEIGNPRGESISLSNLGVAYHRLGDIEEALDYYEQALTISRQIGDRQGESGDLDNIGRAYHSLGDIKQAIDYYEQALAINREIGNRHGQGSELGNLGVVYQELGEIKQALDYYEQAMTMYRMIADRQGEAFVAWKMGLALESQERYAEAAKLMAIGVAYEYAIGHPDAEADAKHLEIVRRRAGMNHP